MCLPVAQDTEFLWLIQRNRGALQDKSRVREKEERWRAVWFRGNSEPRRCMSIAGLAILSLVVCLFELWV